MRRLPHLVTLALMLGLSALPAAAEPLARQLFGAKAAPSYQQPTAIGFYSKGCAAGLQALPAQPANRPAAMTIGLQAAFSATSSLWRISRCLTRGGCRTELPASRPLLSTPC